MREAKSKTEPADLSIPAKPEFPRLRATRGIWRPSHVAFQSVDSPEQLNFDLPVNYARIPVERWGWKPVEGEDELLYGFSRIETAGQALEFARKWGPLYVCSTHTTDQGAICVWSAERRGREDCEWRPREQLHHWMRCAEQVRAALRIEDAIRRQLPRNTQAYLWLDLFRAQGSSDQDFHRAKTLAEDPALSRVTLRDYVNRGGSTGALSARLVLDEDLHLNVDPGFGFLPAVWWQLAQAISRTGSIYICASCGWPFVLPLGHHAPKDRSHAYCDECRSNNYVKPKNEQGRSRRLWLKELTRLALSRSNTSWDTIRLAWNNDHPERPYSDTEELKQDLRLASQGSYHALTPEVEKHLQELLQLDPPQ